MPHVVICIDKPGASGTRNATRASHIDYLLTTLDIIRFAGPLTTDDQAAGIGSFYVLDVEERAAAEAFVAAEPYFRAGMFESVVISRWRCAIPESTLGGLQLERDRARAAAAANQA